MNEIEINGTKYPLHIGLDFIRELDKKYPHKFGDVEFGFGIGKMFLNLAQYNPVALADYILAATNTLPKKPAMGEIEKQFDSWTAADIMAICEDFLDALATSSLTRPQIYQMNLVSQVLDAKAMLEDQIGEERTEENPPSVPIEG